MSLPALTERLYRLVYHGFLARLPEPRAVRLGQALFRALPPRLLSALAPGDPRLAVRLAGVTLPTPVILSSMYHDPAILHRAMRLGFGAVTTKSITVRPRPGHPEPNLVRLPTADGPAFVNCNGFRNPGLDAFRASLARLPRLRPVIVSVAGESVEEYRTLVEALGPLADLVEVNISSPNTRLVYELSGSPDRVRTLLDAVRGATTRPLILKLSPDYPEENQRAIVPALAAAGLDGVNFGNTRRIADPRLSQGAGGLSGPPLFPVVLAGVRDLRKTLGPGMAVIATGGIDTPARALAALEAGADAVGLFTGFITRGPTLPRRIAEEVSRALDHRRLASPVALRGAR